MLSIDVIISDYAMPEMDGLSLLKGIKHGEASRSLLWPRQRGSRISHATPWIPGADYYLQKGADMANEVARLIDFIRIRVPQKNAEY